METNTNVDGVKIERILITPALATQYLKNNPNNRPLSKLVIRRYAEQMKNEQWREDTGEIIKFSESGILIDGQHRLSAVVLSGIGFYFHVATGLKQEVFTVLDTGKKRNASDSLHISDVPNSALLAAAITSFLATNRNIATGSSRVNMGITNEDVINQYNSRPSFWNYLAKEGTHLYNNFRALYPASVVGWLC